MLSQNVTIPNVKLNNGHEIPMIGLGTERTGSDPVKLESALKLAIKSGYRYIDAAWISFIDPVLEKVIKMSSGKIMGTVTREDLFLVCKLWNTYHSKEGVKMGLSDTLTNIGLNYLDCYFINWPIGFKESPGVEPFPKDNDGNIIFSDVHYIETYKAIEPFVNDGVVKSIGLCNFNLTQLQDILKNCAVKPAICQVECHPYFQNDKLVEFCQNNGILVVATSPLGDADLAQTREDIPKVLLDETLIRIGKKYNKSSAQVCLRWCVQRGIVPVPKALEEDHVLENANIFDFQLTDEDMLLIKRINKNFRIQKFTEAKNHKFYPFNEEL